MISPYRTEDLLLPRKKPAARPPLYESRHIAVADSGQKNGGQKNTEQKNGNLISGFSVHLTWITTWATQCTVELGDGQKIVESLMTQNHHRTAHRRTGADFHRSILSPSQAHWAASAKRRIYQEFRRLAESAYNEFHLANSYRRFP